MNEALEKGAEVVMENADDLFDKVLRKAKKSSTAIGAGIGAGAALVWCYVIHPAIKKVKARKAAENEEDLTMVDDEASEE